MSKGSVLTTFFIGGAVTAALSACDVQVHDQTPAQFPANHDVGMYMIKATATADSMVSPGSVYLFGFSGKQRFELNPNRAGTEWTGMYSVRCHDSFPLQLQAVWKLQGLATKSKLVPDQPREIKLVEPDPPKEAPSIDTSGKSPKGGWMGSVKYRFATQPTTQITAAHIEPVSQDPADVAAAKGDLGDQPDAGRHSLRRVHGGGIDLHRPESPGQPGDRHESPGLPALDHQGRVRSEVGARVRHGRQRVCRGRFPLLGFADTAFRGVCFFPHRKFPVNAVRCLTNHDIDTARHCRQMVSIAPERMLDHATAFSTLDTSTARAAHDLQRYREAGQFKEPV
jgi:hypothetical protein